MTTPPKQTPVLGRVARWLDRRVGAADFARAALLNKVFPDHWSFMIGELALYCFVVLILTGTYLGFFFDASSAQTVYHGSYEALRGVGMSAAYRSVLDISFDVRAGLVMRQVHHWAALLFLAAIVVHLARVFFTGAFRRPREINWMIGVTLLILAMINGFLGYSLIDDQLSGTGLRIMYGVVLSVPVIGTWIASLLFGGEFPGETLIGRFYILHILIVPVLIGVLLTFHLFLVVRHKHTQFSGPGRAEDNVVGERMWPTYASKALGLFFLTAAVLCFLGGLFQINPVWLFGPFDSAQVSSASQPDWYMGWLDGALRIMPPWEIRLWGFEIPNPFFPGAGLGGLTFLLLYTWPFIEAKATGDHSEHHVLDRPRQRPLRTSLGVATLSFYLVLFFGAASDVISSTFQLSVNRVIITLRILLIVVPVLAGLITYRLCKELSARDGVAVAPTLRERRKARRMNRVLRLARWSAVAIALALLGACSDHNFGQPEPASDQGEHTLTLWRVFIIAGFAVGGIVLGLIIYVAVRFRRRSDEIPSQKSSNVGWEAVYTITPIVVVAVLFGLSVATQAKTDEKTTPDLIVNVIGFQWGWQFEYPEQGVTVTGSGSAGEQPTLVLAEGRTVRLVLRTVDVIHSFWVPEFLTKRDLIPGIDNSIEITPNRVGTFDGHCAEYCLLDHWRMTFILEIVPPDQFDAELAKAVAATHGGPP